MAAHINVIQRYKESILQNSPTVDSLINKCIAHEIIDKQLYHEIWSQQNRLPFIFQVLFKDARRCAEFIRILELYPKLKQIVQNIKQEIDEIISVTMFGEFPQFPENYVIRNSIACELRDNILSLQSPNALMVYGLPGFGKSSIVSQVLQDKSCLDKSNGVMIWINLGEHKDATNLLKPLKELYSLVASRLGEAREDLNEINDLRNALKKIILDSKLKSAILILDDVKSREVFNVFNLGCKLIVIAQEKLDIRSGFTRYIKMNHGFKECESEQLFKVALDTGSLANQMRFIKEIHFLCDGCPMSLNLIGSIVKLHKESALSNRTDIWESIIKDLKEDKSSLEQQMKLIHRNVETLSPDILKYFHSLSIFPKHANVSHELLMMLWDTNSRTVREIMITLENKSFVNSLYPKHHDTYIYCIHSLIFTYLNNPQYPITVEEFHVRMLSKIDAVINFKENDKVSNYILAYFGHHARNGGLEEKFDYYFNLRFIERKIKSVGSADVLADFETYKADIVRNDVELLKKLEDYKLMVGLYSLHLHKDLEMDIVEFCLTLYSDRNNLAVEEAMRIAGRDSKYFFKIQSYSESCTSGPRLTTDSDITAVCFRNEHEIILGDSSGSIEIRVFNHYDHKIQRFEGHLDEVFKLIPNPDKKSFLSLSKDNTAKLWKLSDKHDVQSPKYKQNNYVNLHTLETSENHALIATIRGEMISADFSPSGDEIFYGSEDGQVGSYNLRNKKQSTHITVGFPIKCIKLTTELDDQEIVACCYDEKIYLYHRNNFQYYAQFVKRNQDSSCYFLLKNDSYFAITNSYIEMWPCGKNLHDDKFLCDISCVDMNDDYILLGTKGNFLNLYSRNSSNRELEFITCDYGSPFAIHLLDKRAIIIEVKGNTLQRREIPLERTEKPKVTDFNTFSCHWKNSSPIYSIADKQKLYIYNASTVLSLKDDIGDYVKFTTFSSCGNCLIFTPETANSVIYYNYKNKRTVALPVPPKVSKVKSFKSETCQNNSWVDRSVCGILTSDSVIIDLNPTSSEAWKQSINMSAQVHDFFLIDDYVLVVCENCKLAIANLASGITKETERYRKWKVITTDINQDQHLLALAIFEEKSSKFYLVLLQYLLETFNIEEIARVELQTLPTVVRFSHNGQILAVGYDTGKIEVVDVKNSLNKSCVLSLHEQAVENLLFSEGDRPVMISIANVIAYWDLTEFQQRDLSSKRFTNGTAQNGVNGDSHDETKTYLRAKKSVFGKDLKFISASKEFKSFLVVDTDGNIYKLDLIATCAT